MRLGILACLGAVIFAPGCVSGRGGAGASGGASEWPDATVLRQRAEQLWTARIQEDWEAAFLFEEPARRKTIDRAAYVKWHEEKEPFKTHAYRLGRVEAERNLGWVEVECRTSLRKFGNAPPRDVRRWEKWRVTEGAWYPIPRQDADLYPEPPALRDPEEAERLLVRFEAAWAARQRGDWQALHGFVDPQERDQITLGLLTEYESLFRHLSREVRWIEAVGPNGRVRVQYERKRNDPSLTKMPPETQEITERWVKRDGEWYCRYSVSVQ